MTMLDDYEVVQLQHSPPKWAVRPLDVEADLDGAIVQECRTKTGFFYLYCLRCGYDCQHIHAVDGSRQGLTDTKD